MIRCRNCCVRGSLGAVKIFSGDPCSRMRPSSIKQTWSAISQTKLRGLLEHYGFSDESPAVEYFALHGERDHEHAAEARAAIETSDDPRLVGLAEAALAANWALLDGVSQN